MKCTIQINWKHWGMLGFFLAGAAYTYVAYFRHEPKILDDLKLYQRAGVGLLFALASAAVCGCGFKLVDTCCQPLLDPIDFDDLNESVTATVANNNLLRHMQNTGEIKRPAESDIIFIPCDDREHAQLCNALVDKYFETRSLGKINTKAFLSLAQEYSDKYPGLSAIQYLAKLQCHGYRYSDIPALIMNKISALNSASSTITRITPSMSRDNSFHTPLLTPSPPPQDSPPPSPKRTFVL